MPSTIENQSGTTSVLTFLAGNARTFIMAALAVSLFLIGGNQIGTAFAQPVADPVTVFTSNVSESWDSGASEEADWPLFAPKAVIATGNANALMAMAEENDFLSLTPRVVIATGNTNGLMAMAEENDF